MQALMYSVEGQPLADTLAKAMDARNKRVKVLEGLTKGSDDSDFLDAAIEEVKAMDENIASIKQQLEMFRIDKK